MLLPNNHLRHCVCYRTTTKCWSCWINYSVRSCHNHRRHSRRGTDSSSSHSLLQRGMRPLPGRTLYHGDTDTNDVGPLLAQQEIHLIQRHLVTCRSNQSLCSHNASLFTPPSIVAIQKWSAAFYHLFWYFQQHYQLHYKLLHNNCPDYNFASSPVQSDLLNWFAVKDMMCFIGFLAMFIRDRIMLQLTCAGIDSWRHEGVSTPQRPSTCCWTWWPSLTTITWAGRRRHTRYTGQDRVTARCFESQGWGCFKTNRMMLKFFVQFHFLFVLFAWICESYVNRCGKSSTFGFYHHVSVKCTIVHIIS